MTTKVYNVLFLCTHNSARSILAEAILNHMGKGRFKGFSAGSSPSGKVNSLAIMTLKQAGLQTSGLSSKSWNEYAKPGAPKMDLVVAVCDNAAGETCPIWPGHPAKVHWGVVDPSRVEGNTHSKLAAFERTYKDISRLIRGFISLANENLDQSTLQQKLNELGNMDVHRFSFRQYSSKSFTTLSNK